MSTVPALAFRERLTSLRLSAGWAMGVLLTRLFRGYGSSRSIRNLVYASFVAIGLATSGVSADPVRIAALGDSLTHGYGLTPEDGFVPQLSAWLADKGADVSMINAGVSGDTTAGGRARVDWTLAEGVDGLIVALGGNDVLRGIDPADARRNLAAILERADRDGIPVLLVGISVPPNYGPDYQSAFAAIYPELAEEYGSLLYPDFLGALTVDEDISSAVAKYMQADAIHPNAEGVARIVADMGPSVLNLVARAR